jgi:hypothetical protein
MKIKIFFLFNSNFSAIKKLFAQNTLSIQAVEWELIRILI